MLFLIQLILPAISVSVTRIPETGTPPFPRLYAVSIEFQNDLYFFGGTSNSVGALNDLHKFDLTRKEWVKIQPIDNVRPMARVNFSMYRTATHIYVHGGLGNNGQLNEMWKFDTVGTLWTRVEQYGEVPPPFHRVGFDDFLFNDIKYFVIGWFGTPDLPQTDDLYIFNTETSTWRILPKIAKPGHEIPDKRQYCVLNYHSGFVYLWGGDISERGSLLYRYDLTEEQWELVTVSGPMPADRTFFGSTVYNDSLIIYPGYDFEINLDIDDFWKFDFTQLDGSTTPQWEDLSVDRSGVYGLYWPRDSYAITQVGNKAYMHAGYSFLQPVGNFLVQIDLDENPVTLTEISKNYDSPTNRYFHTMTVIEGKFYMYGGSSGSSAIDELWVYDESEGTWELIESIGESPGPRMGHAAVDIGNTLIIFGGKNGSVYYKDIYSYNTLTNIWESIQVQSDINPTAVEGACMAVYDDDIYIFGGISEFRSNNYVWKFKLGSNVFELLSADKYQSFKASSYSQCYAINDKLYIMHGVDDDTYNPSEIRLFDLTTKQWSQYEQTVPGGYGYANMAWASVGSTAIFANGSQWKLVVYNQVYTMNLETGDSQLITDLEWKSYAEASVYYKNSLYVFGGGGASNDGAIHLTLSTDRFYKITFDDLPCSAGTYLLNGLCTVCPKGTYKYQTTDLECKFCPRGYYNDKIAGASFKNCLPCPERTFNGELGQSLWLKCPDSKSCPVGSIEPQTLLVTSENYTDVQPDSYKSDREEAETGVRYASYVLFTLILAILIGIWMSDWFKEVIPKFDMFTQQHNYNIGENMMTKRTFLGGLITCFAICVICFLATQTILFFFYDNIEESKALIPIVVMDEDVKGDIKVVFAFNAYGGECVNSDGQCHQDIEYSIVNITGKFSTLGCQIRDSSWEVSISCEDCKLAKNSEILLSSYEDQAYAASISVGVSAESSIPNQNSSIEYEMFAQYREIFRGAEQTVFNFFAIPSIFESEISGDTSSETGYHLSLGENSTKGSSYTVENLSKSRFLHIRISFSQGESALHTKRTYRQIEQTLILAIIGAFAGVLQFANILLRVVEKRYENMKQKMELKAAKRQLVSKRGLENYFDDEYIKSQTACMQSTRRKIKSQIQVKRNDSLTFMEDYSPIPRRRLSSDVTNMSLTQPDIYCPRNGHCKIQDSYYLEDEIKT